MTLMETDIAVVRSLWDAFNAGGVEGVLELTDPDTVWQPHSAEGRTLRGHDDLRAWFAELEDRGARIVAYADSYESVEGHVLVHGRLRLEDFRSVSDANLWWLFGVAGGRVKTARSFTNRDEAVAAAAAS
jgi:ketosteroid isomerase-like protein